MADAYHHGDLRSVVLHAAADQIAQDGVDRLSLRGLAQRSGVSHAAPAHHFGDRRGLFTALATEGFDLLAAELREAGTDLRDVAVAYVRFALARPGHFAVMFRSDLARADDPGLAAARRRSGQALRDGVGRLEGVADPAAVQLAAWSVVHGFASLWQEGAFVGSDLLDPAADPEAVARRIVDTLVLT
ncbi:TetR/AcrR family transcriptional regulator [Krasilnikoviella flava]|uniref:Transcriptional regulator, TetR family n=1 Tax=Krasilnikoviella flava TaxID=526729 RepID=A0A1T5LR75_9MICO|nr:TetR/AcrR family transcriptional regulator [Krasilnikoviella flava]SKC78412.1 transcriptional regulator, TetR family [Krasilnikoviella flava]